MTGSDTKVAVRHPYFLTRCEHCDWQGSSEECGLISYGDDADVTCPKCERVFCADEVEDGVPEIEEPDEYWHWIHTPDET